MQRNKRRLYLVGTARFELAISKTRTSRINQAVLRPDDGRLCRIRTDGLFRVKEALSQLSQEPNGGTYGARTRDLLHAMQSLSQTELRPHVVGMIGFEPMIFCSQSRRDKPSYATSRGLPYIGACGGAPFSLPTTAKITVRMRRYCLRIRYTTYFRQSVVHRFGLLYDSIEISRFDCIAGYACQRTKP